MILKALENVRSHRSFTDKSLTKTELSKIVEGARLGASAKNSQSIRFFCVSDKKLCDEIFEQIKWAAAVSWNPVLEESPRAYVILCACEPLTQTSDPLLHFDMGIASQNMLGFLKTAAVLRSSGQQQWYLDLQYRLQNQLRHLTG